MSKYTKTGYNPKSLKNLYPAFSDPDKAREAQRKGVESRKANSVLRNKVKMSVNEFKRYKDEVLNEADITSVDVLKIMMFRALEREDNDAVVDIAKTLAEFEAPKLARVDQTNVEIQAEELSDDELQELLDQASAEASTQRH